MERANAGPDERQWLVEQFEQCRPHLRAVAYRMLGSLTEADDAVQDAWLRLSRSAGVDGIDDLRAWLTTIVARLCLNVLRSRAVRREDPIGLHVPDPLISFNDSLDPEQQALLSDSVGLALQVVLDTLEPSERLAFVLHDMFEVPFDQIAPMVGSSVGAARQMASRARRRVRGASPTPDEGLVAQRRVVDAFAAAAREGNFDALVAILHPNVIVRSDRGPTAPPVLIRGAEAAAKAALEGARGWTNVVLQPALVNGAAGLAFFQGDNLFAVSAFSIAGSKVIEIDTITDPARLQQFELTTTTYPNQPKEDRVQ